MTKKILAVLLSLAMLLSLVSVNVFAAGGDTVSLYMHFADGEDKAVEVNKEDGS